MNDASPIPTRIETLAAVARRIAARRRTEPGVRVVLANGLFDLFHVGHLRYLRAAARLGDFLVVAVNDDRSARRLRGPGRPVMADVDRAYLISAVREVDAVVLFGSESVAPVLQRLRPDFHCKGTDYTPESVPERRIVLGYGGKIRIAGDKKRHASSSILRSIGRLRRSGVA